MALDPIQEYVQNLKKQIKDANKGVRNGSKEYNTVMKGVEDLDKLVTAMVQDKTAEGRLEKIDAVREQMGVLGQQIDAYMVRSNKKKSLDSKAQRRVNTLTDVKNKLGDLRYMVDDKEIEANALKVHNDNAKIQGEETLINGTKSLYEQQARGLRGKAQLSAKGSLAAANKLHEIAKKSTDGTGTLSPKDVESVKKCMATMVFHQMITGPQGDSIKANMQPNIEDYKKNVQRIVNSKEFNDAFNSKFSGGKVSPEDVHNFLTDYKNAKGLESEFSKNIHLGAQKKAQKTNQKTTTKTISKKPVKVIKNKKPLQLNQPEA